MVRLSINIIIVISIIICITFDYAHGPIGKDNFELLY